MEEIGVVHLARAKNGLEPFENFFASYAKHPAGIDHKLLVVYKGFPHEAAVARWEQVARPFPHDIIFVADWGFDIRAFRIAAERFQCRRLFFLNSFSEILADDWLARGNSLASRPRVGLVGATGSAESMFSNALRELSGRTGIIGRLLGYLRVKVCEMYFDPHPNYHLRTNAFLISRELMLRVWPPFVLTKRGAYLFENGKHSLTRRICQLGLEVLVVDRNGVGHQMTGWKHSMTFRAADQENLLVADNQTRIYQCADSETRARLATYAWGG